MKSASHSSASPDHKTETQPKKARLRLYQRVSKERHASWLELFFDLVFVIAVAELAHLLDTDLSPHGLWLFIVLFVPVWWQWIDFSYYADQFEGPKLGSQLTTLIIMFGVIVLALSIRVVHQDGGMLFVQVYTCLRVLIISLYGWAWYTVPASRELTARYTLSFLISLGLWCLSLVVDEPLRWWLWGLAMFIEIGNGPLTYLTIREVPAQVSHMDERFGLFVLIVLGEAVVAVSTGVADTTWNVSALLTALCGFCIAACLWRFYFERAEESVIHQALRGRRRHLFLSYVYGYSHWLVFVGISATGVGMSAAIRASAEDSLPLMPRLILAGGLLFFLGGTTLLQWATPRSLPNQLLRQRLLGIGLTGVLMLIGRWLLPVAFVVLTLLILVGLVIAEMFIDESVNVPD